MTQIARRRFIAAVGMATVVTPIASSAQPLQPQSDVDTIVVGAGFSGLVAATTLADAGRSVLLLEQSDRVGGRTKSALLANHIVDVGGQWVGPTQTALLALGAHHGVAIEPQYADGDNIAVLDGRSTRYSGDGPAMPRPDAQALDNAIAALDRDAGELNPNEPWASSRAADLDSFTSQQWLDSHVPSKAARDILKLFWHAVFSVEPAQTSHLYALTYIRGGGGFAQLNGVRGSAQDATFVGGVHQIARKMADELGARVHLSARVLAVEQDSDGVRLLGEGIDLRARRAILAMPPSALARFRFAPGLPAPHRYVAERMPLGAVVKFVVCYRKPFWRANGLSGQITSTDGPLKVVLDKQLPGGLGGLVGFFNATDAVTASALGLNARKRLVIDELTRSLGPDASDPRDYVDNDWLVEPGIWGGYSSVPGPGVFGPGGPYLRRPHGRVHFAGSETSPVWPGYIDGAVRSGQRAAAEVLAA